MADIWDALEKRSLEELESDSKPKPKPIPFENPILSQFRKMSTIGLAFKTKKEEEDGQIGQLFNSMCNLKKRIE